MTAEMLPLLTEKERRTLARCVETLQKRLARAWAACACSSRSRAARPWPQDMPIRSDRDLLVLVRDGVIEACRNTIGVRDAPRDESSAPGRSDGYDR